MDEILSEDVAKYGTVQISSRKINFGQRRFCWVFLWSTLSFIWGVSTLPWLGPPLFHLVHVHGHASLVQLMNQSQSFQSNSSSTKDQQVHGWIIVHSKLEAHHNLWSANNKKVVNKWRSSCVGRNLGSNQHIVLYFCCRGITYGPSIFCVGQSQA